MRVPGAAAPGSKVTRPPLAAPAPRPKRCVHRTLPVKFSAGPGAEGWLPLREIRSPWSDCAVTEAASESDATAIASCFMLILVRQRRVDLPGKESRRTRSKRTRRRRLEGFASAILIIGVVPINELRSITIFAKTAELGSLRKAADAQGMTPQAASQALAQLEEHLGVRLFHRTTRSMSLTDEGRQLLETALPALAGLQRALEVTRRAKDEIAGPLRIVGPRSVFAPVLWPLLHEFCSLYPEVQPDVQLDDRIGNWVEDRVDVGFRIGLSPAEGVIARKLFPLQLIICAAPAYLARHGAPDTLHALAAHRCSAFRSSGTGRVLPWHVKTGRERRRACRSCRRSASTTKPWKPRRCWPDTSSACSPPSPPRRTSARADWCRC